MTRFLLLLLPLLPTLASAQTDSIYASENFDYAHLNGLFQQDGGSEQGWAGNWTRAIGDDAILLRNNLETETLPSTAAGTKALLPFARAGIRYNRRMTPIGDEGQAIWMSAIMDWDEGRPSGTRRQHHLYPKRRTGF